LAEPEPNRAGPDRRTILVYRDRVVPRSEVHFLRRLYVGFELLSPVWVGRYRGDGLADLGAEPLLLGGGGLLGGLDRALFKHFGALPMKPDLRALQPSLVHAHFGRGGALALPIARELRVPLVVTFHGGDATKESHYRRRVPPTMFRQRLATLQRETALFVCVSEHIRDSLLARGFPADKLLVHRYGVEFDPEDRAGDRAEDRDRERAGEGGPVLFAGRFVEKKGAAVLLDAMRRLDPAVRPPLVLVGDGPLGDALKRIAAPLGNVEFTGWLPNETLRRRMRGALAVCVPSLAASDGDAEGLPNVVLEAMAEGVPVVASRHAGIPEAVMHEETGLLVPPGDPELLEAALRRLIVAPELRRRLGKRAREVAAERFSAAAQSRRLESILLRVIAGSSG
jgi:glycosyltransferase involved in cell wall biosynthesis